METDIWIEADMKTALVYELLVAVTGLPLVLDMEL
jgi:hypothetical protein